MPIAGLLIVNKPAGWTSSDVVGFVRGRSRVKRVGHAGTLDPAATGVLPLLLGHATRLAEYLVDATKTYAATIELGVETDTYDADGEVLARNDASGVSRDAIEAALQAFRGEFDQLPPAYSAIKREGVPLYKRIRRGEDVALEPRRVRVDELHITAYEPPFVSLEIDCAKGFYVRSLAHDLGAVLGVGGSLSKLVRTRVGAFSLASAVDIETLRAEFEAGTWQERLFAPDEVLLGWQAAILGAENETNLRHGRSAVFASTTDTQRCRAYGPDGDFLAVLARAGDTEWRPEKVFVTA
ncbi:MAG TPA: tRNA pseudouridine(55) synthase TruB [Dehalococcoidia bacterium]|nr:tRNA pseudouridine(55) synthase TruB [Dehalococcoidia bacterium]